MGWFSNLIGGLGKGFGNLFRGGGGSSQPFQSMAGGTTQSFLNPTQLMQQNNMGGMNVGGGRGGLMGGISKLFKGGNAKSTLGGLGLMGLGSIIPNPKIPAMPGAFDEYMRTAGQGGPPLNQSANQYMQSVLSGTNTAANDAATRSLDWSYDQKKRELIAMYKSLRPGTDPTTDSTFQRDLNLLDQQTAQNRADVLSRQQQGAAQYGMQQGNQQMGWQSQGVDALVNQISTQWNMNYNQRQALREQLMGLGTNMMDPSNALVQQLLKKRLMEV